jgi:hypothetical protein
MPNRLGDVAIEHGGRLTLLSRIGAPVDDEAAPSEPGEHLLWGHFSYRHGDLPTGGLGLKLFISFLLFSQFCDVHGLASWI